MADSGAVGGTARLLGFAGLLPQVAAVVVLAVTQDVSSGLMVVFAFGYASLILSFLGGIWWAVAMRRAGPAQTRLAAIAVLPSLLPIPLVYMVLGLSSIGPGLIGLGIALIATLVVDRRLVATGEVPANWMRLRAPLSIGLGGLTIGAGVLTLLPGTLPV